MENVIWKPNPLQTILYGHFPIHFVAQLHVYCNKRVWVYAIESIRLDRVFCMMEAPPSRLSILNEAVCLLRFGETESTLLERYFDERPSIIGEIECLLLAVFMHLEAITVTSIGSIHQKTKNTQTKRNRKGEYAGMRNAYFMPKTRLLLSKRVGILRNIEFWLAPFATSLRTRWTRILAFETIEFRKNETKFAAQNCYSSLAAILCVLYLFSEIRENLYALLRKPKQDVSLRYTCSIHSIQKIRCRQYSMKGCSNTISWHTLQWNGNHWI